jgi:hypothetical protein
MPIPTLAPVDNFEEFAACEVLAGAGTVGEEVEEEVLVDAAAVPDVVLCTAVEPGV